MGATQSRNRRWGDEVIVINDEDEEAVVSEDH